MREQMLVQPVVIMRVLMDVDDRLGSAGGLRKTARGEGTEASGQEGAT